ncbi:MAG TPA: YceI family protein [Burkholderiales bacterium]|nr:YceI family protein [Burkholderiales bacterium]
MGKSAIIALCIFGFAAPVLAADIYDIEPNHTFPRFEYSHFGFSIHHGQFDKTSGKIMLDRAAKTGSVDITVDMASVNMGSAKLEDHLRGDEFFDVAKFPVMTFKSSKLKFSGDVPASAEGELTLHGVTKPLTLTIANVKCGMHPMMKREDCGAEVTGTLKRSDFGLGKFTPGVGDDVTLHIQVESIKE